MVSIVCSLSIKLMFLKRSWKGRKDHKMCQKSQKNKLLHIDLYLYILYFQHYRATEGLGMPCSFSIGYLDSLSGIQMKFLLI